MSDTSERFTRLVGSCLQQLTAARVESSAFIEPELRALLALTGAGAAAMWPTQRWRWRGHEAARQAASYLGFLQPPAGWRKADWPVGDLGVQVIVWAQGSDRFADVLATSGRDAQLFHRHSSGLPRRLVREGAEQFGNDFLGVRLVALAGPSRSLLVTDASAAPVPLAGSELWFAPDPIQPDDLVRLAGELRP